MKNKMIKSVFGVALFAAFLFNANKSLAQNNCSQDAKLISKARVAAFECLLPVVKSGATLTSNVSTVSICFVQGFIKKVTFYQQVWCIAAPCPGIPVAEVIFDCNGRVSQVNCLK